VNVCLSCGSPVCCCQPAVARGFIYADLRSELNTHLAPQALFIKSSPLQAFPFPSTLGEVMPHPLSQAGVFIYSSCGKWAFPPLLWSFPPTTTFISFPVPACWVGAAAPAFSGQLVYLQFCGGFPLPTFGTQGTVPSLLCVFLLLLLIIQFFFFFFPWVGVGLSRGLC
jgi:hypothetical protein